MTDTPEDVERVARALEASEPAGHPLFAASPARMESARRLARAAIAAMPTPWRPIADAPKDGTPFLAFARVAPENSGYDMPPGNAPNVVVAWWGNSSHDGSRGRDAWLCTNVLADMFGGSEWTGTWMEYEWAQVNPTHFMPLPSPPSQSIEQGHE